MNKFKKQRDDKKNIIIEDYVEFIYDHIDKNNNVRIVDIATEFDVSKPTVINNLKKIINLGYAEKLPYGKIELTKIGVELAIKCKERHLIVYNFLLKIGVSKNVAEYDSEGIEHYVSNETLKIMKKISSS